jgi:hypothetical protein
VVFGTATAMAAIRPARDWYLALLGAFAFILAAAGRDYRRHPARRPWRRWPGHIPHILAMGSSYTVLLTAFYVDNGKNLPLWDRLPTAAYWALPALVATPVIARSAARRQPFDKAELEPVMVFDGERQGPHVPGRTAPEVLAADRDAGQLDQRLRRAGRPGQGLDVLSEQQQPARAHPPGAGRAAGNDKQ